MSFLHSIREIKKTHSIGQQILITVGILFLGTCLGTFSKYLDYRHAQLPYLLRIINDALDFHNFLGGFAPWIFIAVCIAVYSQTSVRAAVNVFFFFAGMVSGYYLYCNFVCGFFPKSYAMIWVVFTVISPFLAFICWYAKGKGAAAFLISSGIIGVLINTAFGYGFFYVVVVSWLNLMVVLLTIVLLHKSPKKTIGMIGLGVIIAVISNTVIPFHVW